MSLKLHQLIHSLSGTEKRYFKLHTQLIHTQKPKRYLSLFEILEKIDVYENELLVTALGKHKLNLKNIHADKNYLYEFILDILVKFHAENSGSIKVLQCLSQVEILYRKNLHAQAAIQLRKAQKIAKKHDLLTYHLPILEWSQRITGFPKNEQELKLQHADYEEKIEEFTAFTTYDFVYKKAHLIRKQINKAKDKKALEIWHEMTRNHPLPNGENPPEPLHAQIRFYQIKAAYFYITDDIKNEFEANKKMLELIHAHPHFIQEYSEEYIAIFSRYLVLTKSVNLDLYLKALSEFRQIPQQLKSPTPALRAKIFALHHGTELTRLIYARHFEQAEQLLPDIKAGFERYKKHIDEVYSLSSNYRFAYTYIGLGKFTLALQEVNNIAMMNKSLRPDMFRFSKLLTLLIHFELGNKSLIPYLKKSINLYYNKQKKVFDLERLFLKYITKFCKATSNENLYKELVEFQEKLNTLVQKDTERKALLYFDFTLWVEAKLAGTTMSKLAENKSSEISLT